MESLTAADPRAVGEFRLRARLGAGGMGQVFLATSLGGRMVAVKVIHTDLASDEEFVRRFRAEVDAAQRVSGVYTAPVVAAGVDDRPPWLATAFVPGPPLDKVVARFGPLPGPALWRLASGLAEALRAIHSAGLIHRDLKPANVLLAADGPRVIDFGISRAASDSNTRLTATGSIIGTPSFMSPEQVEARDAGPASDVFSLGSVLVYAATGSSPFSGGPNVSSASVLYRVVHAQPDLSRVPGDIRGLVEACLAKDPASRPGLGQVAAICASAAEHLRLSAAAFWPPDVARVIQEQAAALTAQIDALQEGPGYPSGPGAALQDASAWGSSTTAPRLDRPMTTHPPSQPSYWGPDSHPSFPPGGSLPGGPMPTGPGQGGPVPSYPLARPEYRGTSRRGLIIGAAAAGVAVVGGGAAWLVSSQSKNGTPTSSASTSPPATGATGAFSVGGKGTRRTATWKFTTGNTVSAVPTVADGVVYVGSTDGKVYAVNASTGKQVWASPAGSGTVAPQVVGDVLFMANQNGDFTALDSADGTVAWQVKGKAQAMTQRTWAADGSTVILFSYTDGMQAYDAATGNLKGKPGPPGLYVTNITAAGGVLYALDTQGTLHAIRLAGNATIWQLAVGTTDDQALSLAVGDGHVYVGTKSGTLHSVTAATGHRDWSFPGSSDLLATPVVADGMVFIVDTSGNLRAINADNGKQAWRNSVTAAVFAPAAGNGQVYLSTALTMQAWDATSGKPSWYFQPPNYKIVQATPAVADGTVYVGCSDYNLYAIKALPSSRTEACTGQNLVRKCVRNQRTHGRTGMRLRQLVIITMTAILATLAFGMAPAAKAAPGKSPGASAASVTPLVTCSGHGCDGTNPDSTGCSGTVILVDDEAGAIHNTVTGVTYTANVQLRYSTGCRTIWARILTTDPSVTVLGEIIRNSDGRTLSCTGLMALAGEFGCFTNQLYDGGVTSHARGSIVDTISGAQFNKITTSF